jgi:hypothetical protein
MKYLNSTSEMGIVLDASAGIQVFAHIDASFGVHADFKSHTGGVISVGKGPVYVESSKQKLNSKSSTEAELIAVSDMLSMVIWMREFLQCQGHIVAPATVYQDNQSTIALAEKGYSSNKRSRHVNLRYFFITDRVRTGEVVLEYLPTEEMIADLLTKPLQGELFRELRRRLLNWD